MVKKIIKYLSFVILLIIIIYFLGPKVETPNLSPELQHITSNLIEINTLISKENQNKNIREGNKSRILWADSIPKKTKYSLVYLHGFSASPAENEEIYSSFSKTFNSNVYAPRLYKHGLKDKEPLLDFTAEGFIESTKRALSIGEKIGEKVILMCTSTGATAGLYLAANHPEIEGIILISPNIDIYDPSSFLITKPWGKQILKTVMGGNYQTWEPPNGAEKFWYGKYRIEAILQLKKLIEVTMKEENFQKIKQPLFLGYYYKNENEQDKTVSVKRMLEMYTQISTADNLKYKVAFPEAKNHSIGSRFFNPNYKKIQNEIFEFTESVLNIKPTINE
jgi:pimeloyl-ACP methyl ester carboxylesterase